MKTIDMNVARKLLHVIDAGLVNGMGNPVPGEMCVEAAVCYALDLPHGDDPGCVSQSLRRLKIRLNDSQWTSDQARAKGLRRLALAQLGSAGVLDEREFVRRVGKLAMQGSAPKALRAAAGLFRDGTATKERMLNMADLCERGEATLENTREFRDWAWQIRWGSADADADAAADAAAVAVADAAAVAVAVADADADADAAADAAAAAVADAVAAAAADAAAAAVAVAVAAADADAVKEKYWAAYYAARNNASERKDTALAEFCEGVVQILIEMKAPGCQWLALTEESK